MKRNFILLVILATVLSPVFSQYQLPKLNYGYGDLEPYIDYATMYVHYNNHHAAYTNNLNAALDKYPELYKKDLTELFANLKEVPEDIRTSVRNNGGGYFNHVLFWSMLTTPAKSKITPAVEEALKESFGSVDIFKAKFEQAAATRFGSGWAWLVRDAEGKLVITSTPNQDNPYMCEADVKGEPILTIDVWEHAYYLKYQSKRVDYTKAFWSVVNWEEVEKRLK